MVRGYLNRPELTDERFVPDALGPRFGERLYRTGDLARHRSDGVLEFQGRIDHQVKIRGYRIELGEIEARLMEYPTVREAVVIAREDNPGDKRLVAYLIQEGSAEGAPTLREHLLETLPSFMVPSAFVDLDSFPLTPNLKVDRKALPAPEAVAPQAPIKKSAGSAAPSSDLEKKIAAIWQEALGIPSIGSNDNFFDLGGHSLLMVQVHGKLKETLEANLSLVDLFRYPTISSLAKYVGSDAGAEAEKLQEQTAARTKNRRESLARRRQLRRRD